MLITHRCRRAPVLYFTLAAILVASALGPGQAAAQTITEIIDATGDGAGNILNAAWGIAVDAAGNAYVAGLTSDNAFKPRKPRSLKTYFRNPNWTPPDTVPSKRPGREIYITQEGRYHEIVESW